MFLYFSEHGDNDVVLKVADTEGRCGMHEPPLTEVPTKRSRGSGDPLKLERLRNRIPSPRLAALYELLMMMLIHKGGR